MWGKFWELIEDTWCMLMYVIGIALVTAICFIICGIAIFGLLGFLFLLGVMIL